MSWTDERVEKLKELWAEGMSASQIAKSLGGVTRNAVIGKVHRLGLSNRGTGAAPPRRWSRERQVCCTTAKEPTACSRVWTVSSPPRHRCTPMLASIGPPGMAASASPSACARC